jgi:hypothetical protein
MMAIDWQRWDAMRASLDYCWLRMSELERIGPEGRDEYEAIVEHAASTADRLLEFSGAPRLFTAQIRAQWQRGRTEVMELRERIAEAGVAQMERYQLAFESARTDE